MDGVGVRLLCEEGTLHYREIRSEVDELSRIWAMYPRD
jgi:hypothetical protein